MKRILIVSISGIGNYLMATPLIREIKRLYPAVELSVLVGKYCEELAKHNKDIDRVLVWDKKKWLENIYALRLLKINIQFAVIPSHRIRDALIGFLCRIPIRISHNYLWPKTKDCGVLFTHLVDWEICKHDIESNLDLLEVFSEKVILIGTKAIYKQEISQELIDFGDQYARNILIGMDDIVIGLHPGSAEGVLGRLKRWPIEKFCLLANRLIENKKIKVIFFLGPNEKNLEREILLNQKNGIFVVNQLSIMQTASIIYQCNLFISNDSGLSHLACALNIPVLTLWGPTDPRRSRPYSDRSMTINTNSCEFSPCYTNLFKGTSCFDNKCLQSITVENVLDYVLKLDFNYSYK